jgi:hypothetical protein
MTESSRDSQELNAAPSAQGDPELVAIQTILGALTNLEVEERQRVIDYVFQRLGLAVAPAAANQAPLASISALTATPVVNFSVNDIRSLKEQKRPRSANEMSALVAYYLAELAPPDVRKSEIGTEDITTYFKQAGYPLPSVLRNTLVNAKAAGYFDSASHGLYKLNPVGHNLVAHSLPPGGEEGRPATRSKRTTRKAVKTKAQTKARATKRR